MLLCAPWLKKQIMKKENLAVVLRVLNLMIHEVEVKNVLVAPSRWETRPEGTSYGLCGVLTELFVSGIITTGDYVITSCWLDNSIPKCHDGYAWQPGLKEPRLNWLKKQRTSIELKLYGYETND